MEFANSIRLAEKTHLSGLGSGARWLEPNHHIAHSTRRDDKWERHPESKFKLGRLESDAVLCQLQLIVVVAINSNPGRESSTRGACL